MFNTEGGGATLTDCTFDANFATGSGGGIFNWEGVALTLVGCVFVNNESVNAAGVGNMFSRTTAEDCAFIDNVGSAIEAESSSVSVTRCLFEGNVSGVFGPDSSDLTVRDSRFVRNSGTGVETGRRTGATVTNSTFIGNARGVRDGMSGQSTVRRCLFLGNRFGGMITQGTVMDSLFYGNGGPGATIGGLQVGGELAGGSVINCIIVGNRARFGGGLSISSMTVVANCVVLGNIADNLGSGIADSGLDATIFNSIIWGNRNLSSPHDLAQIYDFGMGATPPRVSFSLC